MSRTRYGHEEISSGGQKCFEEQMLSFQGCKVYYSEKVECLEGALQYLL